MPCNIALALVSLVSADMLVVVLWPWERSETACGCGRVLLLVQVAHLDLCAGRRGTPPILSASPNLSLVAPSAVWSVGAQYFKKGWLRDVLVRKAIVVWRCLVWASCGALSRS